jgi:hypothetical protein
VFFACGGTEDTETVRYFASFNELRAVLRVYPRTRARERDTPYIHVP